MSVVLKSGNLSRNKMADTGTRFVSSQAKHEQSIIYFIMGLRRIFMTDDEWNENNGSNYNEMKLFLIVTT